MVEVRKEWGSFTARWWYRVYKDGILIDSFFHKWYAIRMAKKFAKSNYIGNSELLFKIL